MDRYKVVRDLQGGEFGMGRDFTIEQWRKNALEWCYSDDSYGLAKELYELNSEDVLGYIAEVWALEFKKVRKDKKIDQSDIEAYEDETLDEFYHTRFGYTNETYKVYEIAIFYGKDVDTTIECDTLTETYSRLKEIMEYSRYKDCDRIELSTQEQNEDGENLNTYTWAEIDMNEFRKGEQ